MTPGIFGGGFVMKYQSVDLSPSPTKCSWEGPFVNNISCNACDLGYETTSDTDSSCIFPPFKPYRGWNVSSRFKEVMDIKGSIPVITSVGGQSKMNSVVVLRKGQTYHIPTPNLEPKETMFVGYKQPFARCSFLDRDLHSRMLLDPRLLA